MSKKRSVKKIKKNKKPKKSDSIDITSREKVYGEPQPVKSSSQEKASKALDQFFTCPLVKDKYTVKTNEIYPRIFLHDSLRTKIKRFCTLLVLGISFIVYKLVKHYGYP